VTDWGQNPTRTDARNLLKKQVGAFVAKHGLKDYTAGVGAVACSAQFNVIVAGYYSCNAKTQVCWFAKADPGAGDKKEQIEP
jgi:hypothetical protein